MTLCEFKKTIGLSDVSVAVVDSDGSFCSDALFMHDMSSNASKDILLRFIEVSDSVEVLDYLLAEGF